MSWDRRSAGDTPGSHSTAVQVATRIPNPDVPAGTRIEPDDAQRLEVIQALASFTGLTPASGALEALRGARYRDMIVGSGVILWDIVPQTGNEIFGFDEDSDKAGPYTRWLKGSATKHEPRAQDKPRSGTKHEPRSSAHDKPRFKLNNYYGVPIPGTLQANRTLIEAGQPIWLEVAVRWPNHVPPAADYEIVPMATTGHRGGAVACLRCAWRIEQVDGTTAMIGPGSGGTSSAGSSGASSAPTASGGAPATTDVAELRHVFVLPPGQDSGTFRVTVQASADAYFEPATFTMTVEVKSTAAAMRGLRDAAFGELGARHAPPTRESFAATADRYQRHVRCRRQRHPSRQRPERSQA